VDDFSNRVTASKAAKEPRKGTGVPKEAEVKSNEPQRVSKKMGGALPGVLTTTDAEQPESAMQWATGTAFDTAVVTQSMVSA